jgi:hypothetical protein
VTKKDDRIRSLYDALAESVLDVKDDEILKDCRESGKSPEQIAAHMRDVLRRAWNEYRQRSLGEANQTYLRAASMVQANKRTLPDTAEKRLALLKAILSQSPEAEQTLMAQFRDFEKMTDEDVQSWLERFGHLGLLPPDDEPKG